MYKYLYVYIYFFLFVFEKAIVYSDARMQMRLACTQSVNHIHVLHTKFYVVK